ELGHRVREWWFEGGVFGPQLGIEPEVFRDEDEEPVEMPSFLFPFNWWRLGAEADTRRRFVYDTSNHMVLSIPGIWGVDGRLLHFGPSVGMGLNLTWWENWRDVATQVVNTGKITAEGGWVVGYGSGEGLYAQGRGTWHYDLFGIHQFNRETVGTAGVFLGGMGLPVALEIHGEHNLGNDTVTTELSEEWEARVVLVYKDVPGRDPDRAITPQDDDFQQFLNDFMKQPQLDGPRRREAGDDEPEVSSGAAGTQEPGAEADLNSGLPSTQEVEDGAPIGDEQEQGGAEPGEEALDE
ncbi:MAG: hypothetical protein QGG40_18745, partial [Myxococcota bacterium]|nr:hypothetical protein [Myxococcota bacterium]